MFVKTNLDCIMMSKEATHTMVCKRKMVRNIVCRELHAHGDGLQHFRERVGVGRVSVVCEKSVSVDLLMTFSNWLCSVMGFLHVFSN